MRQYLSEIQAVVKNLKKLSPQKTISSAEYMEKLRLVVKQWTQIKGEFIKNYRPAKKDLQELSLMVNKLWILSGKEKQSRLNIIKTLQKIYDTTYRYLINERKERVTIFEPDKPFTAYLILKDIFSKAKKKIFIFDGYVEEGTLDVLSKVPKTVSIKILTNNTYRKFRKELSLFQREFPGTEVRRFNIHDRFFIVDGACYLLGTSLHSIGAKKPAYFFKVSEEIRNIFKNYFDNTWNRGTKV